MNAFVAFFRGINVGGRNILPMKGLISILESLDCENVKTYIQSGNAVFQTNKDKAEIASEIASGINKSHGFAPNILLLDKSELESAIENNPFSTESGKIMHFFFLAEKPQNPNLEGLNNLKASSESFELNDQVLYLHAPDGIGRSKLVTKIEKNMGVPVTARNWNTVSKVVGLLRGVRSLSEN